MPADLARRASAEMLGTALLLAVVVGSGIMGERLAGGNVAIALLANSLATGFGLVALIVTLAFALRAGFPARRVLPYLAAQFAGAILGMLAAHLMFDLPLLQVSANVR